MPESKEARKQILRFLERMDRTEAELRTKLADKGYDSEAIDDAVAYAYSYGYINDRRFAENYLRIKSSSKSLRQIRFDLRQKGVDGAIIEELLSEAGDSDEQLAHSLIEKRMAGKPLTRENEQKCRGWLYRRGISPDVISSVFKELRLAEDDETRFEDNS